MFASRRLLLRNCIPTSARQINFRFGWKADFQGRSTITDRLAVTFCLVRLCPSPCPSLQIRIRARRQEMESRHLVIFNAHQCYAGFRSEKGYVMRPMIWIVALAGAVAAGLVIAGAQMGPGMMGAPGAGMMHGNGMTGGHGYAPRHFDYMHGGLPAEYRDKTNPLEGAPGALALGRKLFQQNCAACHGAEGRGDGVAGKALSPPPSNLQWTSAMPMSNDQFLYWSVAEGGAKYKTAMPSFKSTLKPNEIWAIIAALRGGDLH